MLSIFASLRLFSMRRIAMLLGISVLLSILSTLGIFAIVINKRFTSTIAPFVRAQMKHTGQQACRMKPQSWRITLPNSTHIYAYDAKTLRSQHPEAPPIETFFRDRLLRGDQLVYYRFPLLRGGSSYIFRVAKDGPCSLIAIRWKLSLQERLLVLVRIASIFLAGMLLCIFLGFLWIGKPLLRRIQHLAEQAQDTGNLDAQWDTPRVDDLGTIARSLQMAHERILNDKRALHEKNAALREHIANIAHDLRTPITSLHLVLERVSQRKPETSHDELLTAMADTVYLSQLTDNLSLAARLEEGLWDPRECTHFDLIALLQHVAARFSVLAREKGVSLEHAYPDLPMYAWGDQILVERALSNLIYNALHHNTSGGNVALLLEQHEDQFQYKIMDDGPGVPPTELPKLSLRHYRSDKTREREKTGQGLGLAITTEVCRRLEWKLQFESIEPKGLSATITGPISATSETEQT